MKSVFPFIIQQLHKPISYRQSKVTLQTSCAKFMLNTVSPMPRNAIKLKHGSHYRYARRGNAYKSLATLCLYKGILTLLPWIQAICIFYQQIFCSDHKVKFTTTCSYFKAFSFHLILSPGTLMPLEMDITSTSLCYVGWTNLLTVHMPWCFWDTIQAKGKIQSKTSAIAHQLWVRTSTNTSNKQRTGCTKNQTCAMTT